MSFLLQKTNNLHIQSVHEKYTAFTHTYVSGQPPYSWSNTQTMFNLNMVWVLLPEVVLDCQNM
jgi:hypothetical protein